MNRYSLNQQEARAYRMLATHPDSRPVIGITANYGDSTAKLGDGYYKQVAAAGGTPVILPPLDGSHDLSAMLDRVDALLLSGGADINPLFMGEEPDPQVGGINAERDLSELLITRMAFHRQMPLLGICRGCQTMAVALGGKVAQHVSTAIKHSQDADRHVPTHSVTLAVDTLLYNIYGGSGKIPVNTFHHQAVSDPGPHFRVAATAPDGIIEAMESTEHKPMLGVQWHPECMGAEGLPLFRWLVDEARIYRQVQQLHDRMLTLDTHCDTPMLFPQGIDFSTRDPRILVDLPKMTEGRLDASIMVAYIPQKMAAVGGCMAYADSIFDKIESIVAGTPRHIALARTPEALYENKRVGKKSIMLGIENGLALEGDIRNVEHFARRGVVYITLCHNGNNDLCDSASPNPSEGGALSHSHGGISDFGEQVIREMNRLGLMVDLSHAAESSFYQALEISSVPIVCSHSSARALCDHRRNLTDEQMRALARKGGVCQITLYPGFLRLEGQASVLDAIAHLEHAIQVMGVDHVGLGTDFDGDGGVPGLADASELSLFTRQLLLRRYSEHDIQQIWGGNFLRVMKQVQNAIP